MSVRTTAIADARLYLCTDARRRQADFAEFLDAVYAGGVDVVQLRDKSLEATEELALLEVLADAAGRAGKPFAVNDRADIALAARAPVLHLGQRDLPVPLARRVIGAEPAIGRSTHTAGQLRDARRQPGVDYYCVGPVWATPTKPGRPAVGTQLIDLARAEQDERPWFAIGGIENLDRLDEVVAHGARRVVVVRMITEADDPGAAARAAADRLGAALAGDGDRRTVGAPAGTR